MRRIRRNKRGISNMISYVILITIALSMAGGVFTWLKFYATIPSDEGKCPEDVSLIISTYSCDQIDEISIKVKNGGLFNIDGFFIRASADANTLPTLSLTRIDIPNPIAGRYDFDPALGPSKSKTIDFTYEEIDGGPAKISIQPFIIGGTNLNTCGKSVSLDIDSAKGCN